MGNRRMGPPLPFAGRSECDCSYAHWIIIIGPVNAKWPLLYVSKSLSARCVFMAHIREGRYHDGTFLGKSESWLPPLPVPSPPLLSLSAPLALFIAVSHLSIGR